MSLSVEWMLATEVAKNLVGEVARVGLHCVFDVAAEWQAHMNANLRRRF